MKAYFMTSLSAGLDASAPLRAPNLRLAARRLAGFRGLESRLSADALAELGRMAKDPVEEVDGDPEHFGYEAPSAPKP